MLNILLLTAEGFDTPNSINHLLMTLTEDILHAGHQLVLVSSHKTGQYEDTPSILKGYQNLTHHVIRRKIIDKNSFVRRYIDEVRFALSAWRIWRKEAKNVDAVVLQSNPVSYIHALLLRIFLKVPIVLNMYDVFPGHAYDIGVIRNKFLFQCLRLVQKILYKLSYRIVAMSNDMKEKLLNEGVPEEKVVVVNNWFDDEVFVEITREENRFIQKYNLNPTNFYVQFAGLLGYVFDYELFVDTAKLLEHEASIKFLLIGDGNLKDKVLLYIQEKNANNILYYPWQPLEIISDVYSACDVGFIPLKDGVIGYGIPSKACQLMAAKRVIINSVEESAYTKLFEQHKMGYSVTDKNPEKIVEIILDLYRNPSLLKETGERAKEYARNNYSRKNNTREFIRVIEYAAQKNKKGRKNLFESGNY